MNKNRPTWFKSNTGELVELSKAINVYKSNESFYIHIIYESRSISLQYSTEEDMLSDMARLEDVLL